MGKVTVAFLDEGDNKLRFNNKKNFNHAFDLSNDYPEIPGYEPIKDNKQDKGSSCPMNKQLSIVIVKKENYNSN